MARIVVDKMNLDPADYSIIAWLVKYEIKTESGKPFDLRGHPFWYDVLTDWSPNIVMLKAAQMGGTTAMAIKLLWAMKTYGLNTAYTMPTADDVKQFVGGRLNPLIRNNPILSQWVVDKDSVEQKRVGNFTANFRGTWTERTALSFPSDLNVHDEEDRSKRAIIDQYASRQQHSAFKWEWRLSNPSVPGNGVSRFWLESDQKHWFITCDHCSKKQFLSWPDSIDRDRKCYVCKHCRKELSEDVRRRGEWHGIKTDVKPKYSGYWFNLMMAPWVSASEILELQRTKSPDYFYNFVLGLPYAGSGNKLNEDEFFQNLESGRNTQDDPIVIGVDTGLPIWYVVGNKQGVFYHGHCDSMDEIERLMKRWPKSIVVGDQGGDLLAIRELQQKYPGRVYLCYYRQDRKTMRLIEWGRGNEVGKVVVDRNRVIQQLIDELRDNRIPLFGTKEDWFEVWIHFANVYREMVEDAAGNERYVWQRSGPDHYLHAMTYWRVGMEKFQNDGARFAGGTSMVELLIAEQSWENQYDDKMPIPKVAQEPYDWRSL